MDSDKIKKKFKEKVTTALKNRAKNSNLSGKEFKEQMLKDANSKLSQLLANVTPLYKDMVTIEELTAGLAKKFTNKLAFMDLAVNNPQQINKHLVEVVNTIIEEKKSQQFDLIFTEQQDALKAEGKTLDAIFFEWEDKPQRYAIKIDSKKIIYERFQPKFQSTHVFIKDKKSLEIKTKANAYLSEEDKKVLKAMMESMQAHQEQMSFFVDVKK